MQNTKTNTNSASSNSIDKCGSTSIGSIQDISEDMAISYPRGFTKNKSEEDLLPILRCENNKVNILDPKTVKVTKTSTKCDKLLILKQGEDSSMVKMMWKGEVDGKKCIGCELNNDCVYGTKGTFNNKELFKCRYKRGVLISLDGNTECCESAKDHTRLKYSADKFIELPSICCIESKDKLESVIAEEIIVSDIHSGKVKWKGIINGKECIGVEINIYFRGFDGTLHGIRLFDGGIGCGVLIQTADLPPILRCETNKVNILDPKRVKVPKESSKCDKLLILKQRHQSSMVRMMWKGKVDGKKCIGCELNNDCDYGTNGTVNGEELFKCRDKRGVLILLGQNTECCEREKKDHTRLKYSADNFIELASICCIDSKDEPESYYADKVILSDKHSGTVQWKGIINAERCIGVEIYGYLNGFDGTINDRELFDCGKVSGALIRTADISDQLICDEIDMKIINHTRIQVKPCGRNIDMYIVQKKTKKVKALKVFWSGNVDKHEVVGCILPKEHKYGTNFTFNGHKLFDSGENREVLIPNDEFINNCALEKPSHKTLKFIDNKFIDENSICCMEEIENPMNTDTDFITLLTHNEKKYLSKCLWSGRINGIEAMGIEMSAEIKHGTDGQFIGIKLFACKKGMGFLVSKKYIELESQLLLIDDTLIKNNIDLTNGELINVGETINKLVCIKEENEAMIYGRVLFTMPLLKESLTGVNINQDCLKEVNNRCKKTIFVEGKSREPYTIIVRSSTVTEFKEELKYFTGSNIVDEKSIKVKEQYESKKVKSGDVVKYEGNFGKIVESILLNNIPCVGVTSTILVSGDKTRRYVEEDNVDKITVDDSFTTLLESTVVSPDSIVICDPADHSDFKEFDVVDFRLVERGMTIEAIIKKIVKVNNMESLFAIVELNSKVDKLSKYRINELALFKDLIQSNSFDVLMVLLNSLHVIHSEMIICPHNNVPILNPACVKYMTNSKSMDKIIILTIHNIDIFSKLKWIGRINNEECIGCEMTNKSPYGTNGLFGNNKIFNCSDDRGMLIPLDKIEQCCVKGQHRLLKELRNGSIEERSICCLDSVSITGNEKITLGSRVISENNKRIILGICGWIGLMNNEKVIGLEMINGKQYGKYEWLDKMAWFDCPSNKRAFFKSRGFNLDEVGLCYCPKTDLLIVDPNYIKSVENGGGLEKKMIHQVNSKINILNIKWRGFINGQFCVGCALNDVSEFGTDGKFGEHKLFQCDKDKGVLILVDRLFRSCEHDKHKPIKVGDIGVDISSVCCVESRGRIKRWPQMTIESIIIIEKGKFPKLCDNTATCKWIGTINGREAVGVEIADTDFGTDGSYPFGKIFTSKKGQGLLFLAEDIEHDIEKETLYFIVDKVVDVNKIWEIKEAFENEAKGLGIGNYVSTNIIEGRSKLVLNGEIKWLGRINGVNCAGIDLEYENKYGMDTVIKGKGNTPIFLCPPRHGIITIIEKVEHIHKYSSDERYPQLNNNGMVNAKRYVEYEEKYNEAVLAERNVVIGGSVFVILDNYNGARWKRKGILRWIGVMNAIEVGVVELDEDCADGCDGVFWRHRIIQCRDRGAIAVPWDNIHQHVPYQEVIIPVDARKFRNININSPIFYYTSINNIVVNVCGIVKWSGKDEHDQYVYGIELNDKYKDATDGYFKGQRLFKCKDGHGIIASMEDVASDSRLNASNTIKGPLFFESRIFDPNSIITLTCIESDHWLRDTNVEFCLNESRRKYYGQLKWTGLVNDIMSAAVYVDPLSDSDPLCGLLCPKEVIDQLNLKVSDNLIIIILSSLNKSDINDGSVLKSIFEFVNDKECGIDILMKIITNQNPRLLISIIKEWKYPINLECYPELLPYLIKQGCYSIISILLDSFVASDRDNVPLLFVAKYYLINGDFQRFLCASKKCRNTNIVLDNGETFLTDIMKDGKDEELVNRIIGSKIFNINMVNREGESTLVVACRQLMVTTVRLLLSSGASLSYNNNMALTTTVSLKNDITEMDKLRIAFEIMQLLTSGITLQHNMCTICMDRVVNTIFSCGHTTCEICSKEIVKCQDCAEVITERKRMFLP